MAGGGELRGRRWRGGGKGGGGFGFPFLGFEDVGAGASNRRQSDLTESSL